MESNNRVLLFVGLLIVGALVFSAYSSEITGAVILGNQVTCSPGNIRGDLDSNNRLTRGDVTNLQRVLSGRYTVSGDNCCVDVNNHGSVSSSDVDEWRRVRSNNAQASRCVVSNSALTSPSSGAATSCDGDGECEALSLTTKRLEVTNPQGPAIFYGGPNQDFEIRVPTDFRESVGFNGDVELNKNVKIGLFNNLPVLETKGNPGAHTLKVNGGVIFEEDVEFRDNVKFVDSVEIQSALTVDTVKIGKERTGIGSTAQLEPVLYVTSVPSTTGFDSFLKMTSDEIEVTLLKGTGNAYVCVNAAGELFRSDTPCR